MNSEKLSQLEIENEAKADEIVKKIKKGEPNFIILQKGEDFPPPLATTIVGEGELSDEVVEKVYKKLGRAEEPIFSETLTKGRGNEKITEKYFTTRTYDLLVQEIYSGRGKPMRALHNRVGITEEIKERNI